MPADKRDAKTTAAGELALSDTARGFISLAIVVQLIVILLVASGNFGRSALQDRTIRVLRPYIQLLNFEQVQIAYHLTHGVERDLTFFDHRFEALPPGGRAEEMADWVAMGQQQRAFSESGLRYQRLAALAAYYAEQEDNKSLAARAAAGITRRYRAEKEMLPSLVRIRRIVTIPDQYLPDRERIRLFRLLQESEAAMPYTAQVVPEAGQGTGFDVIGTSPEGQVAPVTGDDDEEGNGS